MRVQQLPSVYMLSHFNRNVSKIANKTIIITMLFVTQAQARKLGIKRRKKYNNRKTTCKQGHKHDSVREANYCNTLLFRLRGNEIASYDTSIKFELQPVYGKIRAIYYIADFVVHHHDGKIEIIDVKGGKATQTAVFKLKWKMLKYKFRKNKRYIFTIAE